MLTVLITIAAIALAILHVVVLVTVYKAARLYITHNGPAKVVQDMTIKPQGKVWFDR